MFLITKTNQDKASFFDWINGAHGSQKLWNFNFKLLEKKFGKVRNNQEKEIIVLLENKMDWQCWPLTIWSIEYKARVMENSRSWIVQTQTKQSNECWEAQPNNTTVKQVWQFFLGQFSPIDIYKRSNKLFRSRSVWKQTMEMGFANFNNVE